MVKLNCYYKTAIYKPEIKEQGTEWGNIIYYVVYHMSYVNIISYVIFRGTSQSIPGNVAKHSGKCPQHYRKCPKKLQGMSPIFSDNVRKHSGECPQIFP